MVGLSIMSVREQKAQKWTKVATHYGIAEKQVSANLKPIVRSQLFAAMCPRPHPISAALGGYRKVGLLQTTGAILATVRENVVDAPSSEHTWTAGTTVFYAL